MCGLLGFVYRQSAARPELADAIRALHHRGPDDHGSYTDDRGEWVCGLAHTRLSVVDLSSAGHQPMTSADGRWVIAFNGEVYNFRELRAELLALDHRFSSDTDTEVILAAHAQWGAASVERLRGMFAIAIWDTRERTLFLARDRLGVKPLYVAASSRGIAFASEVRALMVTGCAERKLSPDGLARYLAFGSVGEPSSILDGVHPLEPGSRLTFRAGVSRTERYWSLPLGIDTRISRGEAVERVNALLNDSVRLRLRTDVPTGVFLSGGIDSAALVAIASRHAVSRLRTFTVVVDEKEYDEGPRAAAVARAFGCDHHESRIARGSVLPEIERATAALDQPSSDGVNTFVVSQAARASGLIVALSGIGSDEIFAGYENFRRFALARRLSRRAPRSSRVDASVAKATAWPQLPAEVRKLAMLLHARGDAGGTYRALRGMFAPSQVAALLGRNIGSLADALRPRYSDEVAHGLACGGIDDLSAYSALELSNYLLNTLVRDADAMSMAHALEIREPFLDHHLVEYVMSVPGAHKLSGEGNKPLLTAAVEGVPHDTRVRKKMGFTLPFEMWLRGPLRDFAQDRVSPRAIDRMGLLDASAVGRVAAAFYEGGRGVSWSRLWSLVTLSDWCTRHGVTA